MLSVLKHKLKISLRNVHLNLYNHYRKLSLIFKMKKDSYRCQILIWINKFEKKN